MRASKTEPGRQLQGAHCSRRNYPPVSRRVHHRVDRQKLWGVEDIRKLRPELQESRFSDGKNLSERHVEQPLPWPLDAVAPRMAELSCRRRRECGGFEPLGHRWAWQADRFSGN